MTRSCARRRGEPAGPLLFEALAGGVTTVLTGPGSANQSAGSLWR
ncbi:MAG: hypothetical protein ACLSAP_09295 [Oscillospiraceae bacterium]